MKKNERIKGIVYVVEHKPSGKKYVGVSTKSIKDRKKDHIQKANKGVGHQFHDAMLTYGPDNFVWEQVDTASSIDELAQKEREYVRKYNSYGKGFNSDSGGGIKKSVYQYSIDDGSLVNRFECLDDAASAVSASKKSISKACLNVNNIYSGFYWSYNLTDNYIPTLDRRRKRVQQLDENGNVLATYLSVAEASRQTGICKSPIAKTCRGEQDSTKGYHWQYVKEDVELKGEEDGNK